MKNLAGAELVAVGFYKRAYNMEAVVDRIEEAIQNLLEDDIPIEVLNTAFPKEFRDEIRKRCQALCEAAGTVENAIRQEAAASNDLQSKVTVLEGGKT